MRKKLSVVAALAVLTSMLVLPAETARAQTTLTLQVGGFLPGTQCNFDTGEGCVVPGDGMRFYGGPNVTVMSGDTVNFDFMGFHTATLAPANVDISSWAAANAGGIGKPFSLLVPDPDDTALDEGGSAETPSLKANNAAALPSSFTCGPTSTPCAYDGSAVVNSGIPQGEEGPITWAAQINADPGDVAWFLCLVHPHMRGKITVTDDPAAVTPQATIDAAKASQLDADNEAATEMHYKLKNAQSKHTTAAGKVVYDVNVGWDNHWLALDGMYPKKTRIKKGQTVRYHFSAAGVYEDHTATLPFAQGVEVGSGNFVPSCDPDGDAGPGPDNPPDNPVTGCNDITQLELDITPLFAYQQGDGVFNGGDYQNSGVRGANFTTTAPWDLKFKATGTHRYLCLIHGGFMSGKVIVTD